MILNYISNFKMFLNYHFLNFGFQHLLVRGVFRLVLDLYGEVVTKANSHLGLLHNSTKKLLEFKTYSILPVLTFADPKDVLMTSLGKGVSENVGITLAKATTVVLFKACLYILKGIFFFTLIVVTIQVIKLIIHKWNRKNFQDLIHFTKPLVVDEHKENSQNASSAASNSNNNNGGTGVTAVLAAEAARQAAVEAQQTAEAVRLTEWEARLNAQAHTQALKDKLHMLRLFAFTGVTVGVVAKIVTQQVSSATVNALIVHPDAQPMLNQAVNVAVNTAIDNPNTSSIVNSAVNTVINNPNTTNIVRTATTTMTNTAVNHPNAPTIVNSAASHLITNHSSETAAVLGQGMVEGSKELVKSCTIL